jgi:trk system potassium uptake protein TrkA
MSKQCVILGLGRYGMTLAKKLSDSGVEVLAIDNDMKNVEKISSYVTKAICADVTSPEVLESLPLKNFDVGVVCFGENLAASILSCITLQEVGVKHIIAKAGNKYHKQVLEKLKVNEVIFPEEIMGELTAQSILDMKD